METTRTRYLSFDPHPRKPKVPLPAGACDSQFHISGDGYKTREGAAYHSDGATYQAGLKMHGTLGFERGVVVQSTVYALDHSLIVDALKALGPNYRGIGVMDDSMTDGDLARLDEAGICGVRFSFLKLLNLVPSDELFLRSAARCREMGWILKVNLAAEGLTPALIAMIRSLRDQPVVIDHMARIRGVEDPLLPAALDLLRQGNVWIMMSNGHRLSTRPHHDEAVAVAHRFIETSPDRLVWGSDWPHPLHAEYMPNDTDLLELFFRYAPGEEMRRRILVDNPARLFGFPL
jgi:predicted TIM-barrel fold metal-dependent hydrolase